VYVATAASPIRWRPTNTPRHLTGASTHPTSRPASRPPATSGGTTPRSPHAHSSKTRNAGATSRFARAPHHWITARSERRWSDSRGRSEVRCEMEPSRCSHVRGSTPVSSSCWSRMARRMRPFAISSARQRRSPTASGISVARPSRTTTNSRRCDSIRSRHQYRLTPSILNSMWRTRTEISSTLYVPNFRMKAKPTVFSHFWNAAKISPGYYTTPCLLTHTRFTRIARRRLRARRRVSRLRRSVTAQTRSVPLASRRPRRYPERR